jgi:hypothetical protein
MPRTGLVEPPIEERLPDRIALGALTCVFPPELVDQVVAETGRREQRRRLLPARVMVYYVLALALFSHAAYEEVMRCLVEGLGWARRQPPGPPRRSWPAWHVPGTTAIAEARARLGAAPLRALFGVAARPLAEPTTKGAWYRDWRVLAIDGTTLDVPDTPANASAFGRAGSGRGEGQGAFPKVRVVGLAECGTHAIVDAAFGPYRTGEATLAATLTGRLGPGMLALGDRGLGGAELWRKLQATGADLVWRAKCGKTAPKLPVDQALADGSWLSRIYAADDRRRRHPIVVRVLEYTLSDPGRPQAAGVTYRLVTTILDPARAPAAELAALYAERWEQETALDELKTHQRGAGAVLRSRTPDGVEQEVWAHLLVHYALRALMHQAALDQDLDPDRLSFVRSLRVVRRRLVSEAVFSP